MKAYIVDENVPITANDSDRKLRSTPQADTNCVLSCVRELRKIVRSGIIIIDDDGEILSKYRRYLRGSGLPGAGDAFLKHVADRQYDRKKVRRISLAKTPSGDFTAFPNHDPSLVGFDHSDRIFIAVARAVPELLPTIVNAVDSDYSHYANALAQAGVRIKELCSHCLKAAAARP
jgi:hypothetical protein